MTDKPQLELVDSAISDDPFELSKIRVPQDFLEATNVKRLITTVPVRRPGPQDFFRVHPSPKYRELCAFIDLKEDREIYMVNLAAVPELQTESYIATLYTATTRTGVLFMWAVRVPATDGRVNGWHQSAAAAAQHAMRSWIRIKSNMNLGAYEIFEAASSIPDPEWPDLSFKDVYSIAFRDRLIDRLDHPVIKRLQGG
jgi:hypothetical protein